MIASMGSPIIGPSKRTRKKPRNRCAPVTIGASSNYFSYALFSAFETCHFPPMPKMTLATKATLRADERGIQVSGNTFQSGLSSTSDFLLSRALSEAITRFISGVRFVMAVS
jgi:hypothetical protein